MKQQSSFNKTSYNIPHPGGLPWKAGSAARRMTLIMTMKGANIYLPQILISEPNKPDPNFKP